MGDLTINISASRIDGAMKRLLEVFPQKALVAARMAVSDVCTRTRAKGIKISKNEYALTKSGREHVAATVTVRRPSGADVSGDVVFKGAVGSPLRWFNGKPRRSPASVMRQYRTRGIPGVQFKVRRAGGWHLGQTHAGNRSFWAFTKGKKNIMLVWKKSDKTLQTKDLMGPSPIQAIQKYENAQALEKYAYETLVKRLEHQLSRLAGGK